MSALTDLAARAHTARTGPLNDYIVSADQAEIARAALAATDDPEVRAAAMAVLNMRGART